MKQKLTLLLTLWIILFMLTGCWSRQELDDLAIASAIGIDKIEDQYLITVQVINPGEIVARNGGGYDLPVTTYVAQAETLFEALRKLTLIVPRRIYTAHLRIIVLGEELAEEGIAKTLDFLSRYHEMRTDFYILVSKGTSAHEVLTILTSLEKIPANKMFDSLEVSEQVWGATISVQLDDLINDLVSPGKNPVLTGIRIQGNSVQGKRQENVKVIIPSVVLQYSGLGVFKKDKLIGWLNDNESKGYHYIQGELNSTVVNVLSSEGEKVGVELIRAEGKMKGKVENGRPEIDVEIKIEGDIADVQSKIDLSRSQTMYEIEKKVEEEVKTNMEQVIYKAQKEYKTDIFGFGEVIHRSNSKMWKEYKDDWDKEFEDLSVNIQVDVKLRRLGTITDSFLNDVEE